MPENPQLESLKTAHLRIARPTDHLERLVSFYRDGLGFEVLGQFQGHSGFDGVMLGHPDHAYHLEFTRQRGHEVGTAPTQEHLLVFYLPDPDQWRAVTEHLENMGHGPVTAYNSYWDRLGKTYEDPDGYRIVIQNSSWPV